MALELIVLLLVICFHGFLKCALKQTCFLEVFLAKCYVAFKFVHTVVLSVEYWLYAVFTFSSFSNLHK